MSEFSLNEMQRMQNDLQEKYKEKWGGLSPEKATEKLLWLYGELGEVADVIKKNGSAKVMGDEAVRQHFVEEMCDVMMYLNEVLLCYDISPDEIKKAYVQKYEKNMSRW